MKHLINAINGLIASELDNIHHEHGMYYHSAHEAYGVLAEEIDETLEQIADITSEADKLLGILRRDDEVALDAVAGSIKAHALLAACECIQVAAVCAKTIDSNRKPKR